MKRFIVALLAMMLGGVGLSSISAQDIIEREGKKYELRPLNPAYEAQIKTPNTISLSVGTPMTRAKSPGHLYYLWRLFLPFDDRWLGQDWYSDNTGRMASPAVHFSWRRLMNRTFSIGVSAAHSYTFVENDHVTYTDGVFSEKYRTNVFLVGFRCDITYLRRGVFTMYGVLEPAFGVRYQTMHTEPVTEPSTRFTAAEPPSRPAAFDSQVVFMPTFNVYPLCFRFGRRAGAFIEAGWGGSTCLKLGVDCRF